MKRSRLSRSGAKLRNKRLNKVDVILNDVGCITSNWVQYINRLEFDKDDYLNLSNGLIPGRLTYEDVVMIASGKADIDDAKLVKASKEFMRG